LTTFENDGYLYFKATDHFINKWKEVELKLNLCTDFEGFTMDLLTNERLKTLEKLSPELGKGRRISYDFDKVPELIEFRDLVDNEISSYLHTLEMGYDLVAEGGHCDLIVSETKAETQRKHYDAEEGRVTVSWLFNPMGTYSFEVWPGSHSVRHLFSDANKYNFKIPGHVLQNIRPETRIDMEQYSFAAFSGDLLHRGPKNTYGVVQNVQGKNKFINKLHLRFFKESKAIKQSQHSHTTVSYPHRSHLHLYK
jgi:hypothetical protein